MTTPCPKDKGHPCPNLFCAHPCAALGALRNPDYITVQLLGSGYAAIHMRYYDDMQNYDVQQTGLGRYVSRKAAENEARDWSRSDEIELRL